MNPVEGVHVNSVKGVRTCEPRGGGTCEPRGWPPISAACFLNVTLDALCMATALAFALRKGIQRRGNQMELQVRGFFVLKEEESILPSLSLI